MPVNQAKQSERIWQGLQADLAKLSSNGRLMVAEKSGHNIPIDQPGIVVEAVEQMIARIVGSPKTGNPGG